MKFEAIIQADWVREALPPSEKYPNPKPQRLLNIMEMPGKLTSGADVFREVIEIRAKEVLPTENLAGRRCLVCLVGYRQFDKRITFEAEIRELEGVNMIAPGNGITQREADALTGLAQALPGVVAAAGEAPATAPAEPARRRGSSVA